jgi:hypothetical protein
MRTKLAGHAEITKLAQVDERHPRTPPGRVASVVPAPATTDRDRDRQVLRTANKSAQVRRHPLVRLD